MIVADVQEKSAAIHEAIGEIQTQQKQALSRLRTLRAEQRQAIIDEQKADYQPRFAARLQDRLEAGLKRHMKSNIIALYHQRMVRLIFEYSQNERQQKLARFVQQGLMTERDAYLVQENRWAQLDREGFVDRLADMVVTQIVKLKQDYQLNDRTVIAILLQGYGHAFITGLYAEYPMISKKFILRMFSVKYPEKYLLTRYGPLHEQVEIASAYLDHLAQLDISDRDILDRLLEQDFAQRQLLVLILNKDGTAVHRNPSNASAKPRCILCKPIYRWSSRLPRNTLIKNGRITTHIFRKGLSSYMTP